MITCPECRGEGHVKSRAERTPTFIATLIVLVVVLTAAPLLVYNYGRSSGLEQACPPQPAVACPKPTCLSEIPKNCGRIGDEKIVCTRDNGDKLKIGVFTFNSGPYDPIIFYSDKELLEKERGVETKDAGP